MIRIFFGLSLILAASVSSSFAADRLRIGVIQSTTGIAAEDGKTVVQALQLAAEKLNKKVELWFEDDQTSPKNTVSAYHNLKAKGADIIIGATWDFTTNALVPLVERDKTILFNTSTLPESISMNESNDFVFTNSVSAHEESVPFSRFVTAKRLRSLVTIYANNSWGETQKKIYQEIAKEAGLEILDEYSSVAFDQNEWRTVLPAIKSKHPDFLLLLLNKNDLEIFLRRANDLAYTPPVFASKNTFDALGASQRKSIYDGLCFTYPFEQLNAHKDFTAEYRERFGEDPRIYADNTYDALFILSRAFDNSLAKNISLLEALKGTEITGLVGNYRYSKQNSFSLGRASLMCVDGGKARLLN